MRKLLISLLLASAAASPALADPGDHNDRRAARAERQQARSEARSESRAERSAQADRPHFTSDHADHANGGGQQPLALRQRVQPNAVDVEHAAGGDAPDSVRRFRGPRRQQTVEQQQPVIEHDGGQVTERSLRRSDRPIPHVMRTRIPVVSDVPREGTQPPLRVEHRRLSPRESWNAHQWRRDHRYDWRRWRDRHRSWFHLGFYYDPFGWGYRPYSIGWRLWPAYYGSSFWINDPWQYRLPYAPPGTRWIRYYNDAILVDEWTGEVVDVIYNFFW